MVVWNLSDIYDPSKRDGVVRDLKDRVEKFKKYRELLEKPVDPKLFLRILSDYESIAELSSRLQGFAALWHSENTGDGQASAHELQVHQLCADLDNEVLFFSLWFAKLDDAIAKPLLDASGKYRYYLERLRADKPFLLQEREEQIVNLKNVNGSSAISKLYDIFTGEFVFDFDGKQLTQEEINQFKESKDRKQRQSAYDIVLGRYANEEAVLGEMYKSLVSDWFSEKVKIRGFKSSLHVRNHGNDIPDAAVDALLSVVKKNVGLFQEYFELKGRIAGLNKFDRYDLYVALEESERVVSFDDAKKVTLETYRQFDERAFTMAKEIFDKDHVHADIIKGKRSGAFCYSISNKLCPYVLLNHVGRLKDVFTMMHEFGHGIHALAAKNETLFTFHSALPMAETASIFGEMLLAQRLLKESSKSDQIAILTRLLDNQYASIVRQAYFVLFEIAAHDAVQKGATVDELNNVYFDLLKEQFGKLPVADVFKHEWKYIPHIYHTPFYCYAYAFGNLLTLALYKMYEKDGKKFVPKYLRLLSHGGSMSPGDMLKELNVDITKESFWQQGFEIIREEVVRLKKLVAN
ncbi:M3 family oligoendopeptidase [Candidatus Woesearchaeota archaeon]|nr:M3 family oligoendopeptidase [Candidatus Woesearchaeota archaeon]